MPGQPNEIEFELIDGRKFQLWEYHVSHGHVLFRSPYTEKNSPVGSNKGTIDVMFFAVKYLASRRIIGKISDILIDDEHDVAFVERAIENVIGDPYHVFGIVGDTGRYQVAATGMKIEKFRGDPIDIMGSPFFLPRA